MSTASQPTVKSAMRTLDIIEFVVAHPYGVVAQEVAAGRRLLVIFDELFKGTNVKDASDATLAVTTAFSQYRDCFFIVSTHIVEVGEALRPLGNFRFLYLPTVMEGRVPRYPYIVETGISSDRQGMTLIENEGILRLLGAT